MGAGDPPRRGSDRKQRHGRFDERRLVDESGGRGAATAEAIAAARDLGAPVVLVHVRRAPSSVWGRPSYERRLERSLRRGREALAAGGGGGEGIRRRGADRDPRGPGLPVARAASVQAARRRRLHEKGSDPMWQCLDPPIGVRPRLAGPSDADRAIPGPHRCARAAAGHPSGRTRHHGLGARLVRSELRLPGKASRWHPGLRPPTPSA